MRVGANDSSTQLLLDSVQLYKALGGGWQAFEPIRRRSATPSEPIRSKSHSPRGSCSPRRSLAFALPVAAGKPPAEALRAVRTVEIRYDQAEEMNRYVGTVQSRHEVDQAFRVGGKVAERRVDVGQAVRAGRRDRRCWTTPTTGSPRRRARQQLIAATAQARQARIRPQAPGRAEDRRLGERVRRRAGADSGAQHDARPPPRPRRGSSSSRATASSTRCCAPRAAVSSRRCGSRSARWSPKACRSSRSPNEGEPEIVVDVPEDHLATFKACALQGVARERARRDVRGRAARARAAGGRADADLPRAAEARRAAPRCRSARRRRSSSSAPPREPRSAAIPAAAITQDKGQPARVGGPPRGQRARRHG